MMGDMLLGDDLLAWLVLAMGGALFVGNLLALLKPPARPKPGELTRAPVGRSLMMTLLGGVAALWAIGSLLSK
jgi:hypothetical protein